MGWSARHATTGRYEREAETYDAATTPEDQAVNAHLMALYLLLVLPASVALHHLVERPAQRGLNRTFERWLRPRPRRERSSPVG